MLGAIPIISQYASKDYNDSIRLQVARIVKAWSSSTTALFIFVGCRHSTCSSHLRSFSVLVSLLDTDPNNFDMIDHTLDTILRIFRLQTRAPKSSFCVLFSSAGLMDRLSMLFSDISSQVMKNDFVKLSEIFYLFSQSDIKSVKQDMCRKIVLDRVQLLLEALRPSPESKTPLKNTRDGLLLMFKAIKNLSMDLPMDHRFTENLADLIPSLVGYLELEQGIQKIQVSICLSF